MALTLLPAVDVAAGLSIDGGDPLAAALAWQRDGAAWIHLVDLDAAFGRGSNIELLRDIIGRLDVSVELSAGVRDEATLVAALATGAARIIVGTAALHDPQWCDRVVGEHGERVAVGLDVRGRMLAARGGAGDGGDVHTALERLNKAGCARYVVTDVVRDGAMGGPNLDLLREVCTQTDAPVIASGGVSTLDDLRALAALEAEGVQGVITGKAILAGAFTVAEALAVLAEGVR
ncbi:MAG: HisA/HisF-related TIM barrel protein [Micromonosporaceae bacterium]